MTDFPTIIFALVGGVLPALVWLLFWLREDKKNPEPKRLIAWTFFLGMTSVVLTQKIQILIKNSFGIGDITSFAALPVLVIVLWVVVEEFLKLAAASIGGLNSTEDNEPIDPMIYMITAALGFAALENTLFIFGWLQNESLPTATSIIGGNFRFIGATLLHVISSAIIGFAVSLSFYRPFAKKVLYIASAFVLAAIFHTGFNLLVMHQYDQSIPIAFGSVWVGSIFILLAFEKVKTIARQS